MTRALFVLVGGFLGAGKTTALARLAQSYVDGGRRVGLITNDQAAGLVDTGSLIARGFRVEEVAGGCFCCRFDDLASAADRLCASEHPDILLGEPVGSCTDLAATVIQPMKKLHGDAYRIAPYSVLVDPTRAQQMFLRPGFGGFSSNVAYIFRKQLEEADVILLNKIDTVDPASEARILEALATEFPGKRMLRVSAATGEGFVAWAAALDGPGRSGESILEIDYDTYARGEAELGWLNARFRVQGETTFEGDDLIVDLLAGIRRSLEIARLEPAHLKILFVDADGRGMATTHLLRRGDPGERSGAIGRPSRAGMLTINARVQEDPGSLRVRVERELQRVAGLYRLLLHPVEVSNFSPPRPVPVHRFDTPVV